MEAKKHQVFAFVLPVFVLVGCVGIDAIIMVPAYRKFVQKHAMRIKMSTFNTRKDRDRNGKAKPHKHSGIPTLTGKWRHPSMDCWVNYSTPGDHEWKRLYTTLRRRADDRRQCHRVMQGDDPEGIVWFPDCYPQIYYY